VWLFGSFAVIALALAAVGIYGVSAYNVAKRTREFGIRMALGATKMDIMGLVLGSTVKLTLLGVALGMIGARLLTRLLESLLYGVHPGDPLTLIMASLLLVTIALISCYAAARRAVSLKPAVALRAE
jgi:ABC-type antimicrobial peptide transport system permease subunit